MDDVPEVESGLVPVVIFARRMGKSHLGLAGQPWSNEKALLVEGDCFDPLLVEILHLRSRPNEAHIAPNDIDELQQLVQTGSPQECTKGEDQVLDSLVGLFVPGRRRRAERTEFQQGKALSLAPNPVWRNSTGPPSLTRMPIAANAMKGSDAPSSRMPTTMSRRSRFTRS